jgi:hypothetical protein
MSGAITPLPQYAFMAWCSLKKKHRGQLYLYFSQTVKNIDDAKSRVCGSKTWIVKKGYRQQRRDILRGVAR